jgi:hypothetical protein
MAPMQEKKALAEEVLHEHPIVGGQAHLHELKAPVIRDQDQNQNQISKTCLFSQ